MSRLDKLSILGVRSFDNKRSETIQFYSPLTLIVGYNGSGKTTIIECLKYATTGDLPPNSKGGAFIHDPKLCGEREVLAQVKLSFYGTSGAKMVASRNLQLTVKQNARSQKTLDCHLLMQKNGERTAISSRVAELDQLMPQYLGVSKAVLDNVIFCHQDESLWPMSEPSVLKKKFDEIFEALKYTKAIDNIKVLRKKQNEELGKLRIMEQYAKEDKDKGDRAEKKSKQLADEIEALKLEEKSLSSRIGQAAQNAQDAFDHMSQFQLTIASLEAKRKELRSTEDRIDDLKPRMTELPDSDDELRDIIDKDNEHITMHQHKIDEQTRRYGEVQNQIEECRNELGLMQLEHGRQQAAKDAYDRQIEHRKTLVKESARRHLIRGFDGDLSEEQIREFVERVTRMAKEQNNVYEKARRKTQQDLQASQQSLNQLNERKSALHQRREGAKSQISQNEQKLDSLQVTFDQIHADEGERVILESKMGEVEQKLQKARKTSESGNWDSRILQIKTQLQGTDADAEKLEFELVEATKQVGDSAKLEFLKTSLNDSQKKLETMIGAHGSKLTKLLGSDWQPAELEQNYQRHVEQKAVLLKDAEQRRSATNTDLEQMNFKLATMQNSLKTIQAELQEAEKNLRAVCEDEPSEYLAIFNVLEKNRDTLKGDRDNFSTMKDWYGKCLETVQQNEVCRLCERRFTSTKERQAFMKKMEKRVNETQLQVLEEELASVEADFKNMREARESYDTWKRLLEVEIPHLEADINRIEPRRNNVINEIEKQDRIVDDCQAAKRETDSFVKTVQSIVKSHTEVLNFERQINDMTSKAMQGGGSKSLEEIQKQLKEVNESRRSLNLAHNKLMSDQGQAKSQVSDLDIKLRDAQSKLNLIINSLKEKSSIANQMDDLNKFNKEHRQSIKSIDDEIQVLGPQISQVQAQYDDISSRGEDRERELQLEKDRTAESLNELKSVEREISSYIDAGGDQQLTHSVQKIEEIQHALGTIESEQRQTTIAINKMTEQVQNYKAIKQNAADNLAFRKLRRDSQVLMSEVVQLEAENAEVDRDRWGHLAEKHNIERNRLTGEQASVIGQLKSKDDQLGQLVADWETDYKNAAFKYKEAHIKVEAYKAAVDDLGRYGGALDKAIMKYHSVKMEEINRIIEELWRRTYQGTDVDTIMIKSDNETQKGNKSYNYRVVMVKQDVEMDMRGRCSAGQKVLASIIIRLALAECFGQRCGLIALDEPTTNLDQDNIRALAESLHAIIKARQAQSNLQIIVITHDVEFLRHMQASDFGDYYFRVSRNLKQKSEIERQAIADVI